MEKPIIAIAALGGTISMTQGEGEAGITSKIGAQELVRQLPQLATIATIHTATLYKQASASLTFAQLLETLRWADKQVCDGASGVVISQGTDTIEQTAFFFDLFWPHDAPLVVMGAMRGPDAVGFDGLANLLAAVQVATEPSSRGRGVLVVMNDQIHEARRVVKENATQLDTFVSRIHGPVGVVSEGKAMYLRSSRRPGVFALPVKCEKNVLLLAHALDDDPAIVDWAMRRPVDGIVIAGVGAGHVSEAMRDALVKAAESIPVIVCSRCHSGSTTQAVYGYKGSEIDLLANGCLMGGWLPSIKMRLLLLAALWNELPLEKLRSRLADWSRGD